VTDSIWCARCHSPLEELGHVSLVTGGASAGATFFLGQRAEMGEKN